MGFFIVGSAVTLVILQTTLLLLDREQTSWTFSLIEKQNAHDVHTLDMQTCIEKQTNNWDNHSSHSSTTNTAHCLLWYHTSQQITPVLTQWNPHLILLCIACIHCIIALYATKKKIEKDDDEGELHITHFTFFNRVYMAGVL